MASQGFPGTHTTTTTTATTTKINPIVRFDKTYFYALPGWLKCAQILVSLIGYICARVSPEAGKSAQNWYGFVSMAAFWITLTLLAFYLFHLIEKFHVIPWIKVEFGYCALWTVFFAIASIVVCAKAYNDEAFAAAGVFGFICMVLYGGDAFIKFKAWRRGDIAQGERVVSTSTSQTTY